MYIRCDHTGLGPIELRKELAQIERPKATYPENEESPAEAGLSSIAGAGFEPATFGL
jgi:hypothetical protein